MLPEQKQIDGCVPLWGSAAKSPKPKNKKKKWGQGERGKGRGTQNNDDFNKKEKKIIKIR